MQGDRLYLSSSWNDGSSESTDIIALDLQSQKLKKITQTPDQEFSPYPVGEKLYFIRQLKKPDFSNSGNWKTIDLKKFCRKPMSLTISPSTMIEWQLF